MPEVDISQGSDVLPVLYQDESILAVNKPAGLLSIQDGYDPGLPFVQSLLTPIWGRLWTVHRLDKDTSGVLILARSESAHRALNLQFQQRTTTKLYDTLIVGQPEWNERTLDFPLRVNGDRRHRTVVDHDRGKAARTTVMVTKRLSANVSLLSAHPLTGYTHQIRAHCAASGFPIYGDRLYGFQEAERIPDLQLSRIALHARSIAFTHPANATPMHIEAALPDDFSSAIGALSI